MAKSLDLNKQIVFFLPRLHNNIRPLIDGLIRSGFKVTVIVLRKGIVENHQNIDLIFLKPIFSSFFNRDKFKASTFGFWDIPSPMQLFLFFKNSKIPFVVIRNDISIFYMITFLISKLFHKKVIFYNQYPILSNDIRYRIYNSFHTKILRSVTISPVLHKSIYLEKSIESPSTYRKRLLNNLTKISDNPKLHWFPFSANFFEIEELEISNAKIRLITVGKFQPRKHLLEVIFAAKNLVDQLNTSVELFIVGETDLQYLDYRNQIIETSTRISNDRLKITVFENIDNSYVLNLYKNSQYFILASEKEVASFSQVEAFIYGCNLIVYYENGNLDFLPNTKNIQFLKNLSELNDTLVTMCKGLVNSSSNQSFIDIYRELMSPEVVVRRLLRLFEL